MTKEVATTSSKELANGADPAGLDTLGGFHPSEFRVSYVQLLQSQSDAVKREEAKSGEYFVADSMLNLGKEPEFVVLGITQAWVVENHELVKGKIVKTWLRNEPVTAENEGRPWRVEQEDGSSLWHDRTYWLDLMPVGIEDAGEFDVIEPVRFRMGSLKAPVAQQIKKRFMNLKAQKQLNPQDVVVQFGSKLVEDDSNSWLSPTFKLVRKVTDEESQMVQQWMPVITALVRKSAHLEDSGDLEKAQATEVAVETVAVDEEVTI